MHASSKASRFQQITGRAAHIATLDDDSFIEKLLNFSIQYFK